MNLRKIISYLFIFLSSISKAQDICTAAHIDSLNIFSIKIDSLKKSGIDTFLVYYAYCYSDGYLFPSNYTEEQIREKACDYSNTTYVFFEVNGSTFVSKFNKCNKFSTIKIPDSKSFKYYKKYYADLIKETIKGSAIINKDGGVNWSSTDHSCYRHLFFSMKESKYVYVDLYWLNKNVYGGRNINYSHNIKTHTNKLLDLLYKEIENLTFVKVEPQKNN